jgi:hypothetical protein
MKNRLRLIVLAKTIVLVVALGLHDISIAQTSTAPSAPQLTVSYVASGSGFQVTPNPTVSSWGTSGQCGYNLAVIYTEFFNSAGVAVGYSSTAEGYPAAKITIPYSGTYTARSRARNSCYQYGPYSPTVTFTLGKSCSFAGTSVASGSSVRAYRIGIAYEPSYCFQANNQETRTCRDGVLSGTFTYRTCEDRCRPGQQCR